MWRVKMLAILAAINTPKFIKFPPLSLSPLDPSAWGSRNQIKVADAVTKERWSAHHRSFSWSKRAEGVATDQPPFSRQWKIHPLAVNTNRAIKIQSTRERWYHARNFTGSEDFKPRETPPSDLYRFTLDSVFHLLRFSITLRFENIPCVHYYVAKTSQMNLLLRGSSLLLPLRMKKCRFGHFFVTIRNVQYKCFVDVLKVHILKNIFADFYEIMLMYVENISVLVTCYLGLINYMVE